MAAKKATTETTAVETVNPNAGALTTYDYGQQSNLGFDVMTAADVSVPFITMLQALSPEVGQDPNERIKGATVGMLMNTVTNQLWPGDTGFVFVPCERVRSFVEWVPRVQGGGLVGMHSPESDVITKAKLKTGGSNVGLKSEKGNDLVETFYVYGLVLEDENATAPQFFACIAFKSTMIKAYRDTMFALQSVKGLKAPLFAHRLRVTTFADKNAKGAFSNLRLRPIAWKEGQVTDQDILASLIPPTDGGRLLLEAGQKLLEMVRGGSAKVDLKAEERHNTDGKTDEVF